MPDPKAPDISARKLPRQVRSTRLVADILEAAIRVLRAEGAPRFTMARVAKKAGVSVGSLYQYFPNKEAILFRLQSAEWQQTASLLEKILSPSKTPPLTRLRQAIRAFFQSECDEAELRIALEDAAPLYRAAPEARTHRKEASRMIDSFILEIMPGAPKKERAFAAHVVATTMSALGKSVSGQGLTRAEVDDFSEAAADMLCDFLGRRKRRASPSLSPSARRP